MFELPFTFKRWTHKINVSAHLFIYFLLLFLASRSIIGLSSVGSLMGEETTKEEEGASVQVLQQLMMESHLHPPPPALTQPCCWYRWTPVPSLLKL